MGELDRPEFQIDARETLGKYECVLKGHFVGTSGDHLAGYCNLDTLLPHQKEVDMLVGQLVDPFKHDEVETVASTPYAAVPFSHTGARRLAILTEQDVLGIWADKSEVNGLRTFNFDRRGFKEAISGRRVLVLEDMINRMASIKEMVGLVRAQGGNVVGVGSIAANKGVTAETIGVPKFNSLCEVYYETWTPEECSNSGLCSMGEPIIINIGHGDKFQRDNPDYAGGYINV